MILPDKISNPLIGGLKDFSGKVQWETKLYQKSNLQKPEHHHFQRFGENENPKRKTLKLFNKISMAVAASASNCLKNGLFSSKRRLGSLFPADCAPRFLAMAPQKKVNKYDSAWKKQWFGAGLFYEGSEELEVDVFKKIEKRKVLSTVEKAGLLSKAEELGLTLSSIEKLGVLSKAEELGLLSLLEKAADFSPAALASAALPILVAALAVFVVVPDDSPVLVAAQVLFGGLLGVGGVALFVGSIVLEGLQEAD
ncbi:hypothetical protein BUALT_Bualt02G0149100 [Buddleja alternifolia]|uniref:Uncharacterized protein n=1 Tax=Buddleja alternifolia TaxID=168488 RepID=A0AAV6Y713_9LAMI|nr:hypothetical protein BUALT_Bualt02G0149100 [Buddleja alternifolia]